MPDFDVTGPNDKTYTITGPEGSTREQALQMAPQLYAAGKLRPKEERGVGERLATGFMDPFYGMAQFGARMHDPGEEMAPLVAPMHEQEREKRIAAVDQQVKEREAAIQKRAGAGTDWWRLVGEAGNPALYAPALSGGLMGAAMSGMMAGATQPTTDTDHFVNRKLSDATFGGVFGLGAGAVTNVAGRAVSPIIGRAAQELLKRGVELTPGRLAGVMMSRAEDAARSFPLLGRFISNANERSNRTFNIAAINQALEPIGEEVPAHIPAGREAINFADGLLGRKYDELLAQPNVRFTMDDDFHIAMAQVGDAISELPTNMQKPTQKILLNRLGIPLQKANGVLDGEGLKDVETVFGQFERDYMNASDPAQRAMSRIFGDVKEAVRDGLKRQNPEVAKELSSLNYAYAMFKRVQSASSRRAGAGRDEGVFTPMDLAAAVKQKDRTKDKAAYARGDALMQEFAEWGQFVLPQRIPDSGTPERTMWALLGLDVLSGGLVPLAKTAAKAAAVTVPYLPPVTRGLSQWARTAGSPSRLRRGFREGLVGGSAATGVPASIMRFDASGNPIGEAKANEATLRQLPEAAGRVERRRKEREAEVK